MPNSPEQTGSYKRKIRNYLIDSRFQVKYTGLMVLVALTISAVMGSVLYSTTRAMVGESAKVVEESRKVSEESKKVSEVSRMNIRDLASDSPAAPTCWPNSTRRRTDTTRPSPIRSWRSRTSRWR
jgi:hypothetical protein